MVLWQMSDGSVLIVISWQIIRLERYENFCHASNLGSRWVVLNYLNSVGCN